MLESVFCVILIVKMLIINIVKILDKPFKDSFKIMILNVFNPRTD